MKQVELVFDGRAAYTWNKTPIEIVMGTSYNTNSPSPPDGFGLAIDR